MHLRGMGEAERDYILRSLAEDWADALDPLILPNPEDYFLYTGKDVPCPTIVIPLQTVPRDRLGDLERHLDNWLGGRLFRHQWYLYKLADSAMETATLRSQPLGSCRNIHCHHFGQDVNRHATHSGSTFRCCCGQRIPVQGHRVFAVVDQDRVLKALQTEGHLVVGSVGK